VARPGSPTLDSSAANQWSQSYDAAADGTVGNSPSGAWMEVDLDYPSTSPTTSQGTYDPGDAGGMLSPYGDNAWVGGESWGGGQPGGDPVGSPTVPAIASPAPAAPAIPPEPQIGNSWLEAVKALFGEANPAVQSAFDESNYDLPRFSSNVK